MQINRIQSTKLLYLDASLQVIFGKSVIIAYKIVYNMLYNTFLA
jgi:hypothetical protein